MGTFSQKKFFFKCIYEKIVSTRAVQSKPSQITIHTIVRRETNMSANSRYRKDHVAVGNSTRGVCTQTASVTPGGSQPFSPSSPGHIIPRETLLSASGDLHKEVSRRMLVVRRTKTCVTSKDKRMDKLQLCIQSAKDGPAAHTSRAQRLKHNGG